jgi:hypothetical protein
MGDVVELKGMPPEIGRHPLRTINQVAEEQARVYRAFARGKVTREDANSATYQLTQLVRSLQIVRVEDQVEQIEAQADRLGLGLGRA